MERRLLLFLARMTLKMSDHVEMLYLNFTFLVIYPSQTMPLLPNQLTVPLRLKANSAQVNQAVEHIPLMFSFLNAAHLLKVQVHGVQHHQDHLP